MKRLLLTAAVAGFVVGGACASSHAGTIALFNTGVDGSSQVDLNGTTDIHYSVSYSAGGVTYGSAQNAYAATSAGGFPIGPWLGDNSTSTWISDVTPAGSGSANGYFDFKTTFDLTGLNPATASISGQWAVDNTGSILINGTDTGNNIAWGVPSFENWHSFSINSGFIAGTNTLDFIVRNWWGPDNPDAPNAGPEGLRVEMSGTASAVVPEPGSFTLFSLVFATIGGFGWIKRPKSQEAAV
jgi:hypothetical protein